MINNKIKLLLLIFVALTFLYIGNLTYSKYKDKVSGTTDIKIARWDIVVNSESIGGKQILTNDIVPVFNGTEYIKSGVLAPGATGYYDITIDPTNVDVSFNYIITCSNSENSTIDDLIVTGYTINPSENLVVNNYTAPITGSIVHNSSTIVFRIYIKWNDDETATMNNSADTNAILDSEAKALVKTSIEFSQIGGS